MAGFLCVAFLLLVPACERVSGGNPMQPLDSEPPTVGLRIRDPRNEWRETSTIIEGLAYAFDAASTTDDSLQGPEDNVNLTYRWDFGDGTVRGPGKGGPPDGLINVTYAYARYGEYVLNLTVSDASGNPGAIRRVLIIQANASAHPDLSIVPGTLRLVPQDPIEGREVVVSVGIRNSGFGAPARDVRARLTLLVSGRETDQTVSDVQLLDLGGSPIPEIAPNGTASVRFLWTAPESGNHTVVVWVWDADEPPFWISTANRQMVFIEVGRDSDALGVPWAVLVAAMTVTGVVSLLAFLRSTGRRRPRRDRSPPTT